jgi:hypothetical protein
VQADSIGDKLHSRGNGKAFQECFLMKLEHKTYFH